MRRVESIVRAALSDLAVDPSDAVAYLCGNPDMILNVESVLVERGFPEFHVKKELYWPKGKPGAAAPSAG